MDLRKRFCHNRSCWAYGRPGERHAVIHSRKERRYRYKRCGRTFSETKGTALYPMHKPKELVLTVLALLAHGEPVKAIVVVFGLDARSGDVADGGLLQLLLGASKPTKNAPPMSRPVGGGSSALWLRRWA